MATQTRVTFFFQSSKWGWSETLYNSATEVTNALDNAKQLIRFRAAILASGANLVGVRASRTDPQRDSRFYAVPQADGTGDNAWGVTDIPNTCLNIRLEATPLYRRSLQLRGVPDMMITDGGYYAPSPMYTAALRRFLNQLLGATWGVQHKANAAPKRIIVMLLNDFNTNTTVVTTSVAHGYNTGDLVYIGGRSNVKGFNGLWRVKVVDATNFKIATVRPTGTFFLGLTSQLVDYEYQQFDAAIVEDASHRISGRPFAAPRGKRRGLSRV